MAEGQSMLKEMTGKIKILENAISDHLCEGGSVVLNARMDTITGVTDSQKKVSVVKEIVVSNLTLNGLAQNMGFKSEDIYPGLTDRQKNKAKERAKLHSAALVGSGILNSSENGPIMSFQEADLFLQSAITEAVGSTHTIINCPYPDKASQNPDGTVQGTGLMVCVPKGLQIVSHCFQPLVFTQRSRSPLGVKASPSYGWLEVFVNFAPKDCSPFIGSVVNYHGPHYQKNGGYDDPDMWPILATKVVSSAQMNSFTIVNCDGNCSSDKAIDAVFKTIKTLGLDLEVYDMSTKTPTHWRKGKDNNVTGEKFDHCYMVAEPLIVNSVKDSHVEIFKMRELSKWSE